MIKTKASETSEPSSDFWEQPFPFLVTPKGAWNNKHIILATHHMKDKNDFGGIVLMTIKQTGTPVGYQINALEGGWLKEAYTLYNGSVTIENADF